MYTLQEKSPVNELRVLKKQINILHQLGKSINSCVDQESLFCNVYKVVRDALPLNTFYIGLLQNDSNVIDVTFIMNKEKRGTGKLNPKVNGIFKQVIQNKKTILLNRKEGDINFLVFNHTFDNIEEASKSLIMSPIIVKGKVIGVMTTQSNILNAYTHQDTKLFSLICSYTGMALENLRLLQHIDLEEGKLDEILTNLDEGVNIIDAQFKIRFANNWIIDKYGQDVAGKTCYETFFGSLKPCKGCPLNQASKIVKEASLELQTDEGRVFLLTVTPFGKSSQGEAPVVLEIIRDITAQKEYEEERSKKEKLQSVIEFAGVVSHELNQPLTGITGYCALIKEEIDSQDPIYKDITEIEKQAVRLEKLIAKFQNIVRIAKQELTGNHNTLKLHQSSEIRKN